MTLDGETMDALASTESWADQAWRLAERHARHPQGGSTPTVGVDAPARMLSCAVDGGVIEAIDRVASRRGVTRSDLVRVGLALVLHRDAEWLCGQRARVDRPTGEST